MHAPIRIMLLAAALLFPALPVNACSVAATSLSFGAINPLDSRDADSVSSIVVTCPSETTYSISINAGGGSLADRRMGSGTADLRYQVYTDASRSVVWGDGTNGSTPVSGNAGPTGTDHTVYGRIPSQPAAIPGTYTDILMVTVTY